MVSRYKRKGYVGPESSHQPSVGRREDALPTNHYYILLNKLDEGVWLLV